MLLLLTGEGRRHIVVDEPHRGKGYGKELMSAAERELVQRGVARLGLNVFGAKTTAIGALRAAGLRDHLATDEQAAFLITD